MIAPAACSRPADYVLTYQKGVTALTMHACAECACVMFGTWCIDVWKHTFAISARIITPPAQCQFTQSMRDKGGLPLLGR
jgi:hypothetical protein